MKRIADLSHGARIALVIVQGTLLIALLGAALFLSAGTLDWLQAWLLLGVYAACFFVTTTILFLKIPHLMDERRAKHDNVKRWDRPLVLGYQAMYFPLFVVSGLDKRSGGTSLPVGISIAALGVIVFFFVLATWSPVVNTHLETYVRIQHDRNHTVCDSGPYRMVRHPTYIGLALFFIGLPLSLGSLWGLVPGAVAVALLVIRTALEDRTLQAELPGYAAYAQRVRFLWIPGVW